MCMSNIQYGVTACLISDLFFLKFLLLCQILASLEQGFSANIEACNDQVIQSIIYISIGKGKKKVQYNKLTKRNPYQIGCLGSLKFSKFVVILFFIKLIGLKIS